MSNLSATDVRSISEVPSPREGSHYQITFVLALLLYVFLQFSTEPNHYGYGDTPVYASEILSHSQGSFEPGKDPLWEFGHALWRPLGYVTWRAALPILEPRFSDAPILGVFAALIALNIIGGLLCTIFVYKLALNISQRPYIALICTAGFLGANAVLNFMQSGSAYIPGLAFQLIGLHLLERSIAQRHFTLGRACMIGSAWALSACLWFPFVLSLPGMIFFGFVWKEHPSALSRIRYLLQISIAAGIVIAAGYLFVMERNQIRSPQQALAWFREANHGVSQNRGYLRIVTGLPRTFFDLGDDGLALKRYLTKDPYAPVTLVDLFRLSLWKLAVVYASLAVLLFSLWRSADGKRMLAGLMATAVPLLLFAMFLFEPSGSERYLPVYAVLFASFALALRTAPRAACAVLVCFFAAIIVSNTAAVSQAAVAELHSPAIARISALDAVRQPHDEAMLLSFRDGISRFRAQLPFHPLNRHPMVFHFAIEPGTVHTTRWRQEVVELVVRTWKRDGQFWISKRLISDRPLPAWHWAESDDPNVQWTQLRAFFREFDKGAETPGDDGFVVLAPTERNRAILTSLL